MIRRRIGRAGPGLIGATARTAVVVGTATAVSGRVQGRQQAAQQQAAQQQAAQQQAAQQQAAQQQAAQAPAPVPAGATDLVAQLKQLAALKDQGILTEEEFAAQKAKVLG